MYKVTRRVLNEKIIYKQKIRQKEEILQIMHIAFIKTYLSVEKVFLNLIISMKLILLLFTLHSMHKTI